MLGSVVKWRIDLLAALVAVWIAAVCQSAAAQSVPQGSGYRVVSQAAPATMCPGETQRIAVTVENTGGRVWQPAGKDQVSHQWRDAAGAVVVRDGRRSELAKAVEPGERVTLRAKVTAPEEPGRYALVWRMLREGGAWFPESSDASAPVTVAGEGPALAWAVGPFDVLEIAAKGDGTLEVAVTNAGCATWSAQTVDRLSYRWFSTDGRTKRGEGPRTSFEASVAPGEHTTVALRLRGPDTPGRYLLRLAPVREGVAWFGEPVRGDAEEVVAVREAALQWSWSSADVPEQIAAGDVAAVPIEVRNTGSEAWDPQLGDRLSYHWQRDGKQLDREGGRTLLPHRVEPGESLRSVLTVVAPDEPGTYQLAVEPLRERVAWFGPPVDSTQPQGGPLVEIEPPPLLWTQLGVRSPKIPMAGRGATFLLVVRNDGSRAWEPALGDRASYFVLAPDGTRVARGRRTPLPRRIEPGEVVQLEVEFDTPREPGEFLVEFGIVREHVQWFDSDAEPVPLRVFRRSIVWLALGALLLVAWFAALRTGTRWSRSLAWPAWTAMALAILTMLFADLAQFQLFSTGTPVAVSLAALFGLLVAGLPHRFQSVAASCVVALFTFVAWVDLAYAAFFGSLAPLTAVAAVHHLVDAKATVGSTMRAEHVWLVVPLISGAFVSWSLRRHPGQRPRRIAWIVALAFAALGVHAAVTLGQAVRGSLGMRVFSEARNAQSFGFIGAHVFQALRLLRDLGAPPLTEAERLATFAALREIRASPPSEGRGVAEGANLVILQVEALQQWAVDAQVEGRPAMPFLAGAHAEALAYDRVFDQTLQGRTSDAEYLVLASGHALPEGALAFLRADNGFRTLVHALADRGYASYSAHPYDRGFWNRSVLHPAYGFERSDFRDELGRGPRSGWGLADGPFLERFDEQLTALPEPFVAFGITLSLHHPYESFPAPLSDLDVGELQGRWVGNYLQAMNHFDGALESWIERLRARGQLERTVVVVYGDHVTGMGLDDDVVALSGVPDEGYSQIRMHRVPVFVWVPSGELTGRRSTVGGQIDIGVTALHLLGVPAPASAVGTPLFEDGPGFAALPTGGAVDAERMLVRRGGQTPAQGACIDASEPGTRPREDCDALEGRALEQLDLARRVLDHDLYEDAEAAR